jgi:GntR family transcriptional regulator
MHKPIVLSVDPESPLPLYYQIREQLRQRILSGALKPGDALPGEAQLCMQTGVSRMTARQALVQLANEGLVVRQRGRGTFVAAPKTVVRGLRRSGLSYSEIMNQAGMSAAAEVVAQEVVPASPEAAARLGLAAGDALVRIVRRRLLGGEVMSLETSHYPLQRFTGLAEAELPETSLYHFLEQRYGQAPAYALDSLEISVAGPYEAKQLALAEGMPLVLVTTVGYLADDTPVEFTQTIHRGDRFQATLRREREA